MFGSSGVFFFGFSSSVKRSLFFVCDTTDRDDGNDEGHDEGDDEGDNDGDNDGDKYDETSVDNQLDTVDRVDGDIDNFVEEVFYFSFVETNNLPCLFFWGVSKILPSLAMV